MSNMYKLSVKQLNLHVGCLHGCIYCVSSFQRQLKRWAGVVKDGKRQCEKCYQFKPHHHLEKMSQKLPRTNYMQFIFLCSNGDIAFCPTSVLEKIVEFIKQHPDRTFLIQSKDPATFNRVKFPRNVILGTTVETNRDWIHVSRAWTGRRWRYSDISKAPHPSERVLALQKIKHPLKMLTYEPILDFDMEEMIRYADLIKPCMIWLGYDSKPKQNKLPEPPLEKVKQLHWELSKRGFVVMLKTIRKAWWQNE